MLDFSRHLPRFIPDAKKRHLIVFMNDKTPESVYALFLRLPTCITRLYNVVKQA
ncbi:hypothetical protein BN126_955 [Cronobacter sakazakii 680]|nr:hypothetical protein BN128_3325 [Cronobacter sakazakii 696]CCK10805.1 hypothetical protein BN126_955 [Cronobacter sakazakii 680]